MFFGKVREFLTQLLSGNILNRMHYPLVPHEGYRKQKCRRICATFSI